MLKILHEYSYEKIMKHLDRSMHSFYRELKKKNVKDKESLLEKIDERCKLYARSGASKRIHELENASGTRSIHMYNDESIDENVRNMMINLRELPYCNRIISNLHTTYKGQGSLMKEDLEKCVQDEYVWLRNQANTGKTKLIYDATGILPNSMRMQEPIPLEAEEISKSEASRYSGETKRQRQRSYMQDLFDRTMQQLFDPDGLGIGSQAWIDAMKKTEDPLIERS